MLAALSVRDRIACVDSVLVLDLALSEFLAHSAEIGPGGMSAADLTEIRAGLERVQVPVLQYRAAHSRADRARHRDVVTRIAVAVNDLPPLDQGCGGRTCGQVAFSAGLPTLS